MRALVLAAGYGTRLLPLTDELPKPLLPVLGRPLLSRTLDALVTVGCEAVAINLHHLPDAIPAALGTTHRGVPLLYSREDPILGTSGAFVPLRSFFAGCETVLLVNGDSLCEWPLAELLARHRRRRAPATLLLAGRPDPRPFGGGVGIDRAGRVTAVFPVPCYGPVARRFVYAGAYALEPEALDRLPAGASDSMHDLFTPMLEDGVRIESLVTWRPWHDLGTPARYLDALLDRITRSDSLQWRSATAKVEATARLRHTVIEAGVEVGGGSRAEESVLLAGSRLGAGARVRRVVVGPGAHIPDGTAWEDVVLVRWRAGASALPCSRREGDLLVSPLGE